MEGNTMSDTDVAGMPTTDTEPQGVTPEAEVKDEFKSEDSKKAVLDDLYAEREANKELKARLDEFEKAKMSDIERAQSEANDAKTAAEQAARELSVYKLAIKHGIKDPEDIELMHGIASDEAREKFAQRIAAASGPTNPKPDRTQGASGREPKASTADQFASFISDQLSH